MSAMDLSHFLNKRSKELKFSATKVSKKAGISRQTWYRLINADVKQARIETLMRVANALQVSLVELSHLYVNQQKLSCDLLKTTAHLNDDTISFTRDAFYPFNAIVNKGETFEKKWEMVNLSEKIWVNCRLVCIDEHLEVRLKDANHNYKWQPPRKHYGGLTPQQSSIDIPMTLPQQRITLSMSFQAPKETGTVISHWKIVNSKGEYSFPKRAALSCQVRVIENISDFKTPLRVNAISNRANG